MPKVYSARKILEMLEKLNFQKISQKGSHIKMKNSLGKTVIIPIHNKDIPYGTFSAILEQAGISIKKARIILGK